MNLSDPTDLFFDQLRDLYSATSQVILTLPELADNASSPDLRSLLLDHEGESVRHKEAIAAIFRRHGADPDGEICKAIRCLIEVGNEHLAKTEDPQLRDLLLIAHCNQIEQYEIAGYGFTVSLAQHVGLTKDACDLAEMLGEEQEMTRRLARVAANIFGARIPAESAN